MASHLHDVDFIDKNPAIDAYQRGTQFAQETVLRQQQIEHNDTENQLGRASAPSRLRTIDAGANLATSHANVAGQTEPAQVRQSFAGARTAEAGATTAEAGADVATQSVPYKVRDAAAGTRTHEAGATTAEAGADVATQTVPARVRQVNAGARTGEAGATSAETEAGVGQQTAPVRVAGASVNLRTQEANLHNTQMQGFYKAIDHAIAGNIPEAKAIAQANGQNIPDQVWNDREFLIAMKNGAQYAEKTYPNRPRDQTAFMQNTYLPFVKGLRDSGAKIDDPSLPYHAAGQPPVTEPQAPPTPPETAGGGNRYQAFPGEQVGEDGKPVKGITTFDRTNAQTNFVPGTQITSRTAAGAGGRQSVFEQKRAAWLTVHPGDDQGALDYANNKKSMGEGDIQRYAMTQARQEASGDATMKFNSAKRQEFINKRALEIASELRKANAPVTPARPAAPAPAPGAPAGGASLEGAPPGSGTREQPYEATTQDHINWFKQSAPAGSVLKVGEQYFTK